LQVFEERENNSQHITQNDNCSNGERHMTILEILIHWEQVETRMIALVQITCPILQGRQMLTEHPENWKE
jgi:hypothetical protein